MDTSSTRKQQMESPWPNIQRSSGQKLNKSGFENNAKEQQRKVKEELLDDNMSTIAHFGEDRPEHTTGCLVPSNPLLKLIGPSKFLPTYNRHMRKEEFESNLQIETHEETHKSERTDDARSMRNVSVNATTLAESEGCLNDLASPTVGENFDNDRSAWDLDSEIEEQLREMQTSDLLLNMAEIETNSNENIKVKEEELDDNLSTILHADEDITSCLEVNGMGIDQFCPEKSEGTGFVAARQELFNLTNDPLKLIETPTKVLTTHRCRTCKKEFHSKVKLDSHEQMHRLKEKEDTSSTLYKSTGADNSTVDEGSLHDSTMHNIEENFNVTLSDRELDSVAHDGHSGINLYDIHSEANDENQLLPKTNEEQPGMRNSKQYSQPDKFVCLDCPEVFKTKKKFLKHISTHDDYRRYQCSLCEKRFKERCSLLRHERLHSGDRPFKCTTCDESFIRKDQCNAHQRKHTGERSFTCEDCGKTFSYNSNYLRHRKIHSGDKPHSCKFCGWKFIKENLLKRHLRTHTGIKPYRCLICKTRYFSSSKRWKRHVEKHHKESYGDYALGKRRNKSAEKRYGCALCGKGFTRAQNLRLHERIHTGEKPYECNFCDRRFRFSHCFKTHLFTHSGSRPYLCIICKVPFSTKDEMVSHKQQSHRSESETTNFSQIVTADAVSVMSTVQELNSKSSLVTSRENDDGSSLGNSPVFNEMSPESIIDSDIIQVTDVNSAQSGSPERKRNASNIEETLSILVNKSKKKSSKISAVLSEHFEDSEPSFVDNEKRTDPLASVPHEQADETSFMEESNARELAVSPRIQYKRRSIEHIVAKAARKNPHTLYIVWAEDFSMDVASVVSRHESNCVLFVQNFNPSSLSDVFSLSRDFILQTPNVNIGIFSEPIHCFDFGELGLPLKISKESAFESFAKVESKMKKFARTKGMEHVNILSHPKDANSWCNQLLQQLKGRCVISNSE